MIKPINIKFDFMELWIPYSSEYGFIPYCVDKELSTMDFIFSKDEETKVKIGSYIFNYSEFFKKESDCQLACDKLNGISHD